MFQCDLVQSAFTEYDEDGFLTCSHDAYGEKTSGVHPGEVHWQGGSWYRPRDPDTDQDGNVKKGCTIWQSWEGNQNHITLGSDPRAVPKLPRAKKGGAGTYADTGKGQLPYGSFDGEDGSYTLYVPYEFTGQPPHDMPGKAMAISIDVSNPGQECIQIVHGSGASLSLLVDGSASLVSSDKGSSVTVSPGGNVVVNGNTSVQGAVLMGNPSTAVAVVLAPLLTTYLTALETAIQSSIGAVTPGGPAGAAAFSAALTGLAPLKAAIGALLTKAA